MGWMASEADLEQERERARNSALSESEVSGRIRRGKSTLQVDLMQTSPATEPLPGRPQKWVAKGAGEKPQCL